VVRELVDRDLDVELLDLGRRKISQVLDETDEAVALGLG
jgi:hypothetical protein